MGMLGQHTAYWCNIHNYRNHEIIKRDLLSGINLSKNEKIGISIQYWSAT